MSGWNLNALVQRVIVTDDRRGAAKELTSLTQLTPDEILESPYLLIGSVDQMVGDYLRHAGHAGTFPTMSSMSPTSMISPRSSRASRASRYRQVAANRRLRRLSPR